ncbi:hypothetical protein MO867_18570 [Microbulbifer sp. OS29]|uniref:DUF2157 domain-containing protein n=1 Tax=Microbulbifer okhotskensis TaxID=2926617 RepID=A0A9X2ERA0_9GAMM|nr:hypothetical protein [Microbulbifer okhotskensis]MCO1336340.1 hypothetical protein [Microbulbifer okhotskensis]
MYTDEDLNFAVKNGIFTAESVTEFRSKLSSLRNSPAADEENFRLIGGFNDIFIVFACSLVLFSSLWVLKAITSENSIGLAVFAGLSWCLAEFFVLKRRMALPAIMLLLAFVGGTFAFTASALPSEISLVAAAAAAVLAAGLHWLRFRVPITIAVGTAAVTGFIVSLTLSIFPETKNWLLPIVFLCGILTFIFAMYWDASDTSRITRRSDTAFWLHLLSAPLIIHPIFTYLGVLDGNESFVSMAVVLALYLLITALSITIDRRALMVSSLVYVLYALSSLIKTYGGIGYSFALTGVFMGAALLLLSAYWHRVRRNLIRKLPYKAKKYIPEGAVA